MPQQRIVDSKLLEMKHSGVALPAEEQAAFNALQLEAAKLSSDFQNNVLDATKAFSFTVTDKAELGEIPEGARTLFSQRAVAKGFQDSSPDTGPWIISLDLPSCTLCSLCRSLSCG